MSNPGGPVLGEPGTAWGKSGRLVSGPRRGRASESTRGTEVDSGNMLMPVPGIGPNDVAPLGGAGTSTVAPIDGSTIGVAPTLGGTAS